MKIISLENGPFMVNTYLVINEETRRSFIIDPGAEIETMLDYLVKEKLTLEAILATHGHIDHVAGVNAVKSWHNPPFYMNVNDVELLETLPMQAKMFGVANPGIPGIDTSLPEKGEIVVAGLTLSLLYTPGHSRGSLSFLLGDVVFCGDTLFNFSIGRTDLPGGSYEQLMTSIKEKLFTLPDETRVLSGHGPETFIGQEKEFNPFFG